MGHFEILQFNEMIIAYFCNFLQVRDFDSIVEVLQTLESLPVTKEVLEVSNKQQSNCNVNSEL